MNNAFAKTVDIEWEIVGRFRLIKDAASETRLFEIAKLAPDLQCAVDSQNSCGKNDYMTVLSEFEKKTPIGNVGFKTMPDTFYNSVSGKYDKEYIKKPSHWKIKFKLSDSDTDSKKCNWYLDDVAIKGEGNCRNFQFETPISVGQTVRVDVNDGSKGSVTVLPTDILIIGMGDSYASGEGMPDAPAITGVAPAQWLDEKCHRSLLSAQSLTAARLAAEDPHRSVTFISRACSGALIADLVEIPPKATHANETSNEHQKIQNAQKEPLKSKSKGRIASLCYGGINNTDCAIEGANILPFQFDAVKHDLKDATSHIRQPDLVLLSISGNDFGFVNAILNLLTKDIIPSKDKEKRFDLSDEYIKAAQEKRKEVWQQLPIFASILSAAFPGATVIHTGYPNPLMSDGKNGSFCFSDKDGKKQDYLQITEQSGIVGSLVDFVINRLNLKGSQNEYIALHNDFLVPLTGPVSDAQWIEKNRNQVYGFREASIGISCALAENDRAALTSADTLRTKYESDKCKDYRHGKFGFDKFSQTNKWQFSLARNETGKDKKQGIKQLPGFVVNGFCLNNSYKGVKGRWFNVLGDALKNMSSTGDIFGAAVGGYTGTAHPNIYGQLFLAERAWVAIPQHFKKSN